MEISWLHKYHPLQILNSLRSTKLDNDWMTHHCTILFLSSRALLQYQFLQMYLQSRSIIMLWARSLLADGRVGVTTDTKIWLKIIFQEFILTYLIVTAETASPPFPSTASHCVCVCVSMPTHCTITHFGLHAMQIEGFRVVYFWLTHH